MKEDYYSLSFKISWVSIGVNFLISLLKIILGLFSNSIAILSDAVHSLGDMFTSAVVIFSLKVSRKPPDEGHPFGHGRVEDIGGLILSFLLVIIGVSFFKNSFLRLRYPPAVAINSLFISLILITAAVKFILGFVTQKISKDISSPLLKTDAFHHYSDFFTSVAVGGGLIFVKAGFVWVDAFLGIIVSLVIIFLALGSGREFINNLIGKQLPRPFYDKIKKIGLSFRNVEGVHDIEVHAYGEKRVISLHVEVNPSFSLAEAHNIADSIEKKIADQDLGRCIVHVDLKEGRHQWSKKRIETLLKRLVLFSEKIKDFHGIKIITTESGNIFNFHLVLEKDVSLEESHVLSHRVSAFLKEKFGFSEVNIHIEPYEH